MPERVVITGLGPVSSIGVGADAFLNGLRGGRLGTSPIASFDASGFPHRMGGEVHNFRPEDILSRLSSSEWGRTSLFAAAAARLAVQDAGLTDEELGAVRTGSCIGTTSGEGKVAELLAEHWVADGIDTEVADLSTQLPAHRLAIAVNRELGVSGEAVTVTTACSASNYAIGLAYDLVASGQLDIALAGGADSVARWAHAGFFRLGALAETVCRPFSSDRGGILCAEGGAAVVLETLTSARARGAHIYCEVLGYGVNCDANHMVSPDASSIAECIRQAHEQAGVKPGDVDYVCAHGTGTPTNDAVESAALRMVFGDSVPPTSSIKSMLGHAMGAASGFGAIASALAIRFGFIPPTINFSEPDPGIDFVDCVPNEAREIPVNVVQNNGFAFGGNNAIVVLGAMS
ncbi:beta-ketoacyl-[acyl-carrier-protein] synthase family protein [Nocardia sp. NPDC059177]|uniref:beta-ketoacyl-[acyl-carrier-protein] synthase family protein n=1 Tax=Nocardia sp. NPDC059177 TaxID=3346759 RepID=UPI0036C6B3CE